MQTSTVTIAVAALRALVSFLSGLHTDQNSNYILTLYFKVINCKEFSL